ncbi:MAG: hypothetical protein JWO89_3721 [Verrucomicrobiaceae bacterium]|nr:hypothetical protein [Verrucomicrobiaceae bacterium]
MSTPVIELKSPFFLLIGWESCWQCTHDTRVVGIASGDPSGEPRLLNYIKAMPEVFLTEIHQVHSRFAHRLSQTASTSYFMNFCECGASIGDHYIFSEPGHAFFPMSGEDMKHIEVHELPFIGTFQFECSTSQGIGKDIIEQAKRMPQPAR